MTQSTLPSFGRVTHPSFQLPWLLEGLDRLFAADGRIERVEFDLWGRTQSGGGADLYGGVRFLCRETEEGRRDTIPEEDLDEISAVRLLERRAAGLWHHVPMVLNEEGYINGAYSLHAERGLIRFSYDLEDDETRLLMEARHNGVRWLSHETITVPADGVTLVDLASGDHEGVMDQVFDLFRRRFASKPTPIGMERDLAEGTVILIVEPGCLSTLTCREEDDG